MPGEFFAEARPLTEAEKAVRIEELKETAARFRAEGRMDAALGVLQLIALEQRAE
jgi:hypothetical protein